MARRIAHMSHAASTHANAHAFTHATHTHKYEHVNKMHTYPVEGLGVLAHDEVQAVKHLCQWQTNRKREPNKIHKLKSKIQTKSKKKNGAKRYYMISYFQCVRGVSMRVRVLSIHKRENSGSTLSGDQNQQILHKVHCDERNYFFWVGMWELACVCICMCVWVWMSLKHLRKHSGTSILGDDQNQHIVHKVNCDIHRSENVVVWAVVTLHRGQARKTLWRRRRKTNLDNKKTITNKQTKQTNHILRTHQSANTYKHTHAHTHKLRQHIQTHTHTTRTYTNAHTHSHPQSGPHLIRDATERNAAKRFQIRNRQKGQREKQLPPRNLQHKNKD